MTLIAPPPAPLEGLRPTPRSLEPALIVTPPENPIYTSAMLADLLESVRVHGQLVPGWVCPSPELEPEQRLCLEGNRRLQVARNLGLDFWAFDIGRFVPEEERICLLFQHNHSRRLMSRDEIIERTARYIEITGCTATVAAKRLGVSNATLSRAFGEKRIPPDLKDRTARLGLSMRALIASVPPERMAQAIEFAETPGVNGKTPNRDAVATLVRELRKPATTSEEKGRVIPLKLNGRAVTVTVRDSDTAASVVEDLKTLASRLAKHDGVPPEGWPFLFS